MFSASATLPILRDKYNLFENFVQKFESNFGSSQAKNFRQAMLCDTVKMKWHFAWPTNITCLTDNICSFLVKALRTSPEPA